MDRRGDELVDSVGLGLFIVFQYGALIEYFAEHFNAFFLLRCVQLGISIRDLDLLTIGMVNDMYAESSNDDWNYNKVATQSDFDKF